MKTIEEAKAFFKPIFDLVPCNNIWLAGGSLREFFETGKVKKNTDYDIYFQNEKDYKIIYDQFSIRYNREKRTKIASLWHVEKLLLHLISFRSYKSIESVVETMDYTVCSGVLSKAGEFHSHDKYFEHIENKKLFLNTEELNSSYALHRLVKYLRKGYDIDDQELDKLNKIIISGKKNGTQYSLSEEIPSKGTVTPILQPQIWNWLQPTVNDTGLGNENMNEGF